MTGITVQCPLDDCTREFSKESREKATNSVVAHMTSSKGAHEGIGYQKARQLLDLQDISDTNGSEDITDKSDTGGSTGLGLGGPPESIAEEDPSDGLEEDGAEDSLTCIACRDDLGVTDDELREEYGDGPIRLECSCGVKMRWSA